MLSANILVMNCKISWRSHDAANVRLWRSLFDRGLRRSGSSAEAPPAHVEFNRDIRPILSDACFNCHGPDSVSREADLRLDTQPGLYQPREETTPVVPRDVDRSELFRRLVSDDEEERMPPADSGRSLSKDQIELFRRWIEQGAAWQPHWSFIPPTRPEVPQTNQQGWSRSAIDGFIARRLEQQGLTPSQPADRRTLFRRVSLDLTGLPPTPDEVREFLQDSSDVAYERIVDRLLASKRYGEHMAGDWLDLARYADTSGYQTDGPRDMWRWRDWVIEAFNANMPYDTFTIEQIAGDMLPDATLSQRIATGFNRNHRGNAEGGALPEEFAVEYVVDRVETTFTVWLGLTIRCARCHEHKFDPISQTEFYQTFSYFNNVPEYGRAIKEGNSPPFIKAPTRDQQHTLERLREELTKLRARREANRDNLAQQQREWEERFDPKRKADWNVRDGLALNWNGTSSRKKQKHPFRWRGGTPKTVNGPVGRATVLADGVHAETPDAGDFGYFDKFTISLWVRPDASLSGTLVSRMEPIPRGPGYSVDLRDGRVQLNLVKRWLDDSLRVETERRLEPGRWQHVTVTYDGSRVAKGIRIYVDGVSQTLKANLDAINQSFASEEPLRIGAGGAPYTGGLDEVRVYSRVLAPDEVRVVATATAVSDIVPTPLARRTPNEQHKLREAFEAAASDKAFRKLRADVIAAERELAEFDESLPTVMVMQEMPTPRPTHFLIRGQYDKPGERVQPGLPVALGKLPSDAPNNRLGFARWLVQRNNPLTARVAVNRLWQQHFGVGLVLVFDRTFV